MGLFSYFNRDAAEIRVPKAEVLPDGRRRLTRYLAMAHSSKIAAKLEAAWGDIDDSGTAPTGWEGLRLIARGVDDSGKGDASPVLAVVYEQIHQTAETRVGKRTRICTDDGRPAFVDSFIQFSTADYSPKTVGTATPDEAIEAYLLKEEAPDDGTLRRISRTYVYGGVLEMRDFRRGTLALRSIRSARSEPATPSGYVLLSDKTVTNPNGYPIYDYTFAALSDSSYTVDRLVDFTYPGRAKAFVAAYNGRRMMDIFKSPPVTAKVLATIEVSYQTASVLGTIADLWNPKEWAVARTQWIGWGDNPHGEVFSLAGYRALSPVSLEETATTLAPYDLEICGHPVYGGTTAKIELSGGPEAPDNNRYTLDAWLDQEPSFTSATGIKYYRRVTVKARIPAQADLPV